MSTATSRTGARQDKFFQAWHAHIHDAVTNAVTRKTSKEEIQQKLAQVKANWAEAQQQIQSLPEDYENAIMAAFLDEMAVLYAFFSLEIEGASIERVL